MTTSAISTFPSLKDLNRPDSIMHTFNNLNGPGLALFAGRTGAGVSTTLAAVGAEWQQQGYSVLALQMHDDEVLPGIPAKEVYFNYADPKVTTRSIAHSVLSVYQPDVIIIDTAMPPKEIIKIAVDLAKADALVLMASHVSSPEDAAARILNSGNDITSHELADVLVMSVHHEMVPAEENEFPAEHWKAVGRAENLMSMANPSRFPFAYQEDRKVQSTVGVYIPTERWSAPRMDSYLSSKKWKSEDEFIEILKSHRVIDKTKSE